MATVTFTPVIYSQYKRRDGAYTLKIRVTFKRKSKFLPTNITVRQEQLTRSLKIRDAAIKAKAGELVMKMEKSIGDLDMFSLDKMTIENVVQYIVHHQTGTFRLDFVEFAKTIISEKGGNPGMGYRSALKSFISFMKKDSFDISVVTSSLMRGFERWLIEKYGEDARAVSAYTSKIAFIHKQARMRYNNEESGETLIKNPFEFYKPPKQKPGRHIGKDIHLLNEMIARRKELSKGERLGVDTYILCFCLMGMNCPDLYECSAPSDGVLHYFRTKTRKRRSDNAEMYVKIDSRIAKIVSEYEDKTHARAFDFYRRYGKYEYFGYAVNRGLLRFEKRINYPEHLTLYSARHTWASIARNDARISKDLVNDGLCHVDRDMKVTDGYIKKDWRPLWEANEKVLDLLNWENLI